MSKSHKNFIRPYANLNDVREYYDPHSGIAGTLTVSPLSLRVAANELSGKKVSLTAVKKLFEEILTTEGGGAVDVLQESVVVSKGAHSWRMLRHRAP